METFIFETEETDAGLRLDKYLSEKMEGFTRSFLQKLMKDGQITVDEQAAKAGYRIKPAQTVKITLPPAIDTEIVPENIPLDILYEDEDLLIVNKPKHMVVHPSAGHTSGRLE